MTCWLCEGPEQSHQVVTRPVLQVRVVRIFNTYGPRMALDDGRVVSNFVAQALTDQDLTVYGDGQQTRSFQYVSDLIKGMALSHTGQHASDLIKGVTVLHRDQNLWQLPGFLPVCV